MSNPTFTDEPPVMDPDKPVRCLWFVMYRMIDGYMAWGSRAVEDVRSEGPFEDREAAVEGAKKLNQSGYLNVHILAIVPAIFQDGDYIEAYKPYEKPKPVVTQDDIDRMRGMIDQALGQVGAARVEYPLPDHIDVQIRPARAAERIYFDIHHNAADFRALFDRNPAPKPPPVRINPGDGIAKALEAKVENLRRTARIQDKIPARDTTLRGLRRDDHRIKGGYQENFRGKR